MKKCKKALDVWKKSPTHKSNFWTSQKVVQVADYKGFRKPYKTCLKLILLVKMRNILILAGVSKQRSKFTGKV